jgi:hypothetical protein
MGRAFVTDTILQYLHLLAASIVVGKVVLLSFVVAPSLAATLEREAFGTVVRRLFPSYYALGVGAASIGLLSIGSLGLLRGLVPALLGADAMWLFVLAAEGYCRSWLTPQSNAMRDRLREQEQQGGQDPSLLSEWDRLHRRSVYLNSLVLIAGLWIIWVGMGLHSS